MIQSAELEDTERVRLQQMMLYEEEVYSKGFNTIAGVDEAGRGPLAGPVVAAACVLPRGLLIAGVNDSKQLTPKQRENLFQRLTSDPSIHYGIGIVQPKQIDKINIYQASIRAMRQALSKLSVTPDFLLIDGMQISFKRIKCQKIIDGDALSCSIAAASIIAKETRDEIMRKYHKRWPKYGFDQHKGYGTPQHLEALEKYGVCSIHRRSFEPVRVIVNPPPEQLLLF